MHVLALDVRLRMRHVRSLKEKRSVIRPLIDRLPRLGVAVAEVDEHEVLQNARLGMVAVSGSPRTVEKMIDDAERLVWSRTELEVVSADRIWMEMES